jgi:choice-of-anchor A domain-containing protein
MLKTIRHDFCRLHSVAALAMGLTLAASAGTAQATSFTAQQLLSSFNLIATGAVSTQSDIEGSAVIGGNLNGATFFNNSSDLPANPSVYEYGTISNTNVNISNGGNLYYTGTTSQVNFNGGGQHYTTLPNTLSAYTTPLTQLSTKLGTLAATAGTSIVNGSFNANGATGLVVFNLTASQLATDLSNNQVTFSGNPGVTGFIVNVTGNFAEGSSTNFNTAQQNALFNFTNATSVTLGNWKTSVLAPSATLNIQNGFLDGSVFAGSFTGGGELHNDNLYDGALPSSVPESTTWAMMLAGFAMVGFALRARRNLVAKPALALA